MSIRVGNGYDVHLLSKDLPLVLGGVKIEHYKGCVAHSDGDVIIHALCDAMLGALSLGDIGKFFPDTSDEYKDIDSRILLKRTYNMVLKNGYRLVNADCTLLLQRPKISPYVNSMCASLSSVLGVDINQISVKATTTEGAGFIGREEGVAAYAIVLLEK